MEILKKEGLPMLLRLTAAIFCFAALLFMQGKTFAAPQNMSGNINLLETASGDAVNIAETAKKLNEYDVIFFGEFHDSQTAHEAELHMLRELYKLHKNNLVLSLEMFERDVQSSVDDFLNNKVTEGEFLNKARPWPQCVSAYKPLLIFAKEHHIPVIASEIPRRIASAYAQSDSLQDISGSDKLYLPEIHKAGSEAYRKKFFSVMHGMATHGMDFSTEKTQRFFMAQCLKDDTMAESIALYKDAHPEAVICQVQGEFHSEGGLGAAEKLRQLRPQIKMAVIDTVEYEPAKDDEKIILNKHNKDGMYLLLAQHKK